MNSNIYKWSLETVCEVVRCYKLNYWTPVSTLRFVLCLQMVMLIRDPLEYLFGDILNKLIYSKIEQCITYQCKKTQTHE